MQLKFSILNVRQQIISHRWFYLIFVPSSSATATDEDVMSLDVPLPLDGWKVKVLSLLQKGRNMFVENSNEIGSFEVFSSRSIK